MEIWEQSDDRRIAAAQARWAAEFEHRHAVEGGLWPCCSARVHAAEGHRSAPCGCDVEMPCSAAA
jgi:hypothetical protein